VIQEVAVDQSPISPKHSQCGTACQITSGHPRFPFFCLRAPCVNPSLDLFVAPADARPIRRWAIGISPVVCILQTGSFHIPSKVLATEWYRPGVSDLLAAFAQRIRRSELHSAKCIRLPWSLHGESMSTNVLAACSSNVTLGPANELVSSFCPQMISTPMQERQFSPHNQI